MPTTVGSFQAPVAAHTMMQCMRLTQTHSSHVKVGDVPGSQTHTSLNKAAASLPPKTTREPPSMLHECEALAGGVRSDGGSRSQQ